MLKQHTQTNEQTQADHGKPVATIINLQTEVPMNCDQCDCDNHYTIGHLRQLPQLTCDFCNDSRRFSHLELVVLEKALREMGFYLAG